MRAPSLPLTALAAAAVLAPAGCGGGGGAHASATAAAGAHRTAAAPSRSQHRAAPPLVRGDHRGRVAILMYHVISTPTPGAPYPELWTPAATFAAQMRALRRAGDEAVTMQQVQDAWHGGPGLPRHPVVVSFDDGYLGDLRAAAPVLRRLGWRGVLNLEVDNVKPGDLTRRQVRRLIHYGWEIDAHTISHPDLTTLDAAQLHEQVAGSRAALRRMFGVPARFFAYPAGRYDATVQAAVRAAGYLAAVTTEPGIARPADDPTALPRIRVSGAESPAALVSAVRGGPLPAAGSGA